MSEGSNDGRRGYGLPELSGKLEAIRKALDALDEKILSVRRCVQFMNEEIDKNNVAIQRLMTGNVQRLVLLKEFQDTLGLCVDQRDAYYKEYIGLVPIDIIKDVNSEIEKIVDINKLNISNTNHVTKL